MSTLIIRKAERLIPQSELKDKKHYQILRKKFHTLRGLVHKEDIIKNVYASHKRASKYMRQKLPKLEGENQQAHNYSWRC